MATEESQEFRRIVPNHQVALDPRSDEHPNFGCKDNHIKTTKYSVLTFIPKNLYEQFHRVANLYFVFIVILNFVPEVGAFAKEVAMLPVLFVLSVTAVKDAFEDYRRFCSDREINQLKVSVYSSIERTYVQASWQSLHVGDVVRLTCNEVIPGDLILLSTSDANGGCYIDTANLDGESNLKQREVVKGLGHTGDPSQFTHVVQCEPPNKEIYKFNGSLLSQEQEKLPVGKNNILLRGCILRNTDHIEGVIVYAGHETKAMLNNRGPRYKRSRLECQINRDVLWCVVLLLLMCLLCSVGTGVHLRQYVSKKYAVPFVFSDASHTPILESFIRFWTYIIIFQVMIPLPLYVTIELIKLGQVYFITNDLDLYHEATDARINCRALNITEDLGQVEVVFSDKTGTLTENKMVFKSCCVQGIEYSEEEEEELQELNPLLCKQLYSMTSSTVPLTVMESNHEVCVWDFFLLLAVCNTVAVSPQCQATVSRILRNGGCYENLAMNHKSPDALDDAEEEEIEMQYEAESPDELALVNTAARYGCRLLFRSEDTVTVSLPNGSILTLKLLHILHFDSERKRMSIIFQHPITQEIILYCKGADSAIFSHLNSPSSLSSRTQHHVTKYARSGLRTLCMARRTISSKEYAEWLLDHNKAENSLSDRDSLLTESASSIECNLELMGATGIEDQLQDGVPETILSLRQAGIDVWVLTGDKQETALNIAYSCQLIASDQYLVILNAHSMESTADVINSKLEYIDTIRNGYFESQSSMASSSTESSPVMRKVGLVVDGTTLSFALQPSLRMSFLQLASQCHSVLCCRATPHQKAAVVRLVRDELKKLTLAIGDGANDVNMIQTADLGIGICGQEGMQAVMASDFAIARFRFLRKLLLVHGHWCFDRLARMTLYMWYKNAVFIFLSLWLQFFSGFSGLMMFDDFNSILFNIVYTSLPPIIFGIFDQDVPADLLYVKPELYRAGQRNETYTKYSYFICIADAVWQSLVQFFIPYLIAVNNDMGLWEMGFICLTGCFWSSLLTLCIEVKYWHAFHWISLLISIFSFYIINVGLGLFCLKCTPPASPYFVSLNSFASPVHWFCVLLISVCAVLPRLMLRALKCSLLPDSSTIIRMYERVMEEVRSFSVKSTNLLRFKKNENV